MLRPLSPGTQLEGRCLIAPSVESFGESLSESLPLLLEPSADAKCHILWVSREVRLPAWKQPWRMGCILQVPSRVPPWGLFSQLRAQVPGCTAACIQLEGAE